MVPLFCAVHLAPPSVVLRIVPFAPTAHPTLGAGNATSYRFSRLPLFWGFHEAPPFVVARIVPPLPAARPAAGGATTPPNWPPPRWALATCPSPRPAAPAPARGSAKSTGGTGFRPARGF